MNEVTNRGVPMSTEELKPGDIVYLEPNLDEVDDDTEFDTSVVVVFRNGKPHYVHLIDNFDPDGYYRVYIHNPDAKQEYRHVSHLVWACVSTFDEGERWYRTQAEAIRGVVAFERKYQEEQKGVCDAAERIAERLEGKK